MCGIIYCAREADTVEMAFELKSHGILATFYHAGMDNAERMLPCGWKEKSMSCVVLMHSAWGLTKSV